MTTTPDFMPGPALQIQSTLPGYDVNQTAEKARPVKRDAFQMEKGLSKLDTQECATIKKKKENKKESDSDSLIASDIEIMHQQNENENETKETDALKIQKLKVNSSAETYRLRMTTAHDFMPGSAFQIPSQTLLEYDVDETTKKVHAIKEDALQIERGLRKLDTPEYTTITPQVKEMKEKAANLIEKSDSLIGDMETMRQRIEKEKEETEQLKITVEELKSKCEKLALEIKNMKDKMEKLEESENIIHLAQVTWLFERYAAMFVLPLTEKVGWLGGYTHMKKYINAKTKNKKEREKRLESKERWLKLQNINEVQWSEPDHFGAIEVLREVRKPDAHPPVDFLKAKEDIENITPQNTEECLDIIRMVETLNSVMLLGCLACKLQELTATEWENLTSEIEWSPDHDKALIEMKTLKGNAEQEVLQEVDLEEAKKHLNGYVPDELLRQCFDIVDILKNMPLQCDYKC